MADWLAFAGGLRKCHNCDSVRTLERVETSGAQHAAMTTAMCRHPSWISVMLSQENAVEVFESNFLDRGLSLEKLLAAAVRARDSERSLTKEVN